MLEIKILLLLIVANGSPIVARNVFKDSFSFPLDAGRMFIDQRPVLGHSKTVRGLLFSVVLTGLAAYLVGMEARTGFYIAFFAMLGDLFSSFIKRRLNKPPSSMAPGLDQVPEALFPLLYCMSVFKLEWGQVFLIILLFIVIELFLSKILYIIGIRKRPY